MKKTILIKDNFSAPLKLVRKNYRLEILNVKHNEDDFEAFDTSRASLDGIFGPRDNWPESIQTLDQNSESLKQHLIEFEQKYAYTYTIIDSSMKSQKQRCLGCLYIYPSEIEGYGARVDFWFRDDSIAFEVEFFNWLKQWLDDSWGIKKPCFPGREIAWKDYYNLLDNY